MRSLIGWSEATIFNIEHQIKTGTKFYFLALSLFFVSDPNIAVSDDINALRLPQGIYGGNTDSPIGKRRIENWEASLIYQEQAALCLGELDSKFDDLLDLELSPQGGITFCKSVREGWRFTAFKASPRHLLDSLDGVFSERVPGWISKYSSGDRDIYLTYRMFPVYPNLWKIDMTDSHGAAQYNYEEIYLWEKDFTSLTWFGQRPPDIDGVENVVLLSCSRVGCRSVYRMPHCRDESRDARDYDMKLVVGIEDDAYQEEFLRNYDWAHGVAENIRQKFLNHSCKN